MPLLLESAGRHEADLEDTGMRRSALAAEMFAEKEFYLDEFHDKSLLVALRVTDWLAEPARPAVLEVLTTLLRNDTRLVLLLALLSDSRVVECPVVSPAELAAPASGYVPRVTPGLPGILRVRAQRPQARQSVAPCAQ